MRKTVIFILIGLLLLVSGGCGSVRSNTAAVGDKGSPAAETRQSQSNSQPAAPAEEKAKAAGSGLQRKVAREVSLVITVPDVKEAASRMQEMVEGVKGYIQSANIWQNNERMQGSLTLRLPAEKLDEMLPRLEALGQVERKSIEGKDITEQYYDTQARKNVFEQQEKRYLELLKKAQTVKDMIEIENELARVRSQIESLQAQLKVWDNLTEMATVNIELQSPMGISTGATLKEPFGQRLKNAWLRGCNGMVNLAEGLVVLIVLLLPYLPVLAVIGYVLYRIWEKKRRAGS